MSIALDDLPRDNDLIRDALKYLWFAAPDFNYCDDALGRRLRRLTDAHPVAEKICALIDEQLIGPLTEPRRRQGPALPDGKTPSRLA